jgi:hypothetical protein
MEKSAQEPDDSNMPKRSSKRSFAEADENQLGFEIVRRATGEPAPDDVSSEDAKARSEAARILGRLGGKVGGPARAKALSREKRAEIARKAAKARWRKGKSQSGE